MRQHRAFFTVPRSGIADEVRGVKNAPGNERSSSPKGADECHCGQQKILSRSEGIFADRWLG